MNRWNGVHIGFKVPLFRRSVTIAYEGYSVALVSWEMLRYETKGLSVDFYIESGAGEIGIEKSSFERINFTDAVGRLTSEEQSLILMNITAALEWRGWTVQVIP